MLSNAQVVLTSPSNSAGEPELPARPELALLKVEAHEMNKAMS